MTQFALFKTTHPNSNLIQIDESKDAFLTTAAKSLFPVCWQHNVYQIWCDGQEIDSLIVEAQRNIADGFSFEYTRVYQLIKYLSETAESIVFWYGSDYQDIKKINNLDEAFTIIKKELNDSICEIYICYEKPE